MITVGIVSFNRLKYLKSLIKSLEVLDKSRFKVSVVDNGSWESGLVDYLKIQRDNGSINDLTLRPIQDRNWINDEYIAKNIIIDESKDDLIVFLQDDLQFIGDQEYLTRLCEDFEKSDFLCMEFNGIRRETNANKFRTKRTAVSENGLRYWASDKPHYQTMGIFRRKTFLEFGPYPTNWPKERSYWGRSEDYYDALVKKKHQNINMSCHFPAFLGVWNDHRGGYAFFRNDLRYGDYLDPQDNSGLYYQQYSYDHIKSLQDTSIPLSFIDVAKPIGWKITTTADGDQAKYSQNNIVDTEKGVQIV